MRRRELLAAAAAAALARPAAAVAAADGDAGVLERLIALEDAAAVAHAAAAVPTVPGLAGHEADHAKALRTHLNALGGRAPRPPAGGAELTGAARTFAGARGAARLDAAIALEAELIAAYRTELVELAALGILQTAATILASHAQHHALLLRAAGRDPFRLVPAAPAG